jgi:hypothetical protein
MNDFFKSVNNHNCNLLQLPYFISIFFIRLAEQAQFFQVIINTFPNSSTRQIIVWDAKI